MELTNQTPLTAKVEISELDPGLPRIGVLTAKATYRFDAHGGVELDREDPFPVFPEDEETELGLLPRDNMPREDDLFQVILLGAAYAPPGRTLPARIVRLTVGDQTRELAVYGDRRWTAPERPPAERTMSEAEPYERLPLTWSRAFGGSLDVEIDREAFVTVSDPRNQEGRGFDCAGTAESLGRELQAPEGYPKMRRERELPNLEAPDALIRSWGDAPRPACWATVPLSSALHAVEMSPRDAEALSGPPSSVVSPGIPLRAHPDWILPRPPGPVPVQLEGLTPEGWAEFMLPDLAVEVDAFLGGEAGRHPLQPTMLVLLPEERRFYLVYRMLFTFGFEMTEERSLRLRADLEPGVAGRGSAV